MLSTGFRALLAMHLVITAGCFLPERDNPNDPSRKPVARLVVADQTLADGECPESPAPGNGVIVDAASRGRCLVLDASGSTDPQQSAENLRYEFHVRDSGEWRSLGSGTAGVLALSAEERHAFPAPVTLEFRVRVGDRTGADDTAELSFDLQNARPQARLDPVRSLPLGGHPWDDGTDPCFTVDFDASGSTDADLGDDAEFSFAWSVTPAQDPLCGAPMETTGPVFTLRIPKNQFTRSVATVTVSDGRATSLPATSAILVRVPEVLEVSDRSDFDGNHVLAIGRVDASFEQLSGGGLTRQDLVATLVGTSGLVAMAWQDGAGDEYIGRAHVSDIETFLDGPSPFMPLLNVSLHSTPAEPDSVWVVEFGAAFDPGDEFASVWSVAGAPAAATPLDVPITDYVLPELTLMTVDAGFNLWVGHLAMSDSLGRVSPATGTVEDVRTPNPARAIGGMSARPGSSGEVWVVEVSNIFGAGDGAPPRLLRYYPDLSYDAYVLPATYATGLGWLDESRVWLGLPGKGAWLLDVANLPEGLPGDVDLPPEAIALEVPLTVDPFLLVADPFTGDAHIVSIDGTGAVVDLDGGAFYYEESAFFLFVQDDGRKWFFEQGDVFRGFAVNPSGTYATVVRTGSQLASERLARDARGGGFWLPGSFGGLEQYSADGGLVAEVTEVRDAVSGEMRPIPVIREHVRVEPDGRHLWYFASHIENGQNVLDQLERIDVTTSPPTGHVVLDATDARALFGTADAKNAGFFGSNALLALSDPRAPAPFAWVARVSGTDVTIATMDVTGNLQDRFTFPAGEFAASYGPRGRRLPVSNRLCIGLGDVGGGSPMVHIRILDPVAVDPVVMEVHEPLPTDEYLGTVTGTREPDGTEVCWYQVGSSQFSCEDLSPPPGVTRISGYRPDGLGGGVLHASFTDLQYNGVDLTPAEAGHFLYESRRCSDGGSLKVKLRQNGAVLEVDRIFDASGAEIVDLVPLE